MDNDLAASNFETACRLITQGEFELAYKYVSDALKVARAQGNGVAIGACLSIVADIHQARGDPDAAEACLLEGLAESRKAAAPPHAIEVLVISLGEIAHQRRNLVDAERYFREALDLIGNDAEHPHYLVLVERLAEILFQQENFPQSARLQRKALAVREQYGDVNEIVGALRNLGLCERALGNYSEAIACFERGCDLAKQIRDFLSVVICTSEQGFTHASQGQHGLAVDAFRQALALQELHNINTGHVIEIGLAHSLMQTGAADEALQYFEMVAERPDYVPSFHDLLDRSACHLFLGHHQEAIDILDGQLRIARVAGDAPTEAACLGSLGMVHRKLGNKEEAREYFKQSLLCHQRLGDAFGEDLDRRFLAEIEGESENWTPSFVQEETMLARPDAKEVFLGLREKGAQEGNLLGEINALDRLGVIARGSSRFEEAVQWHEEAVKLSDSLESMMRAAVKPTLLNNLGIVYRILGNYDKARNCYEEAIAVIREEFGIENPFELLIRSSLAKLYVFMGDAASAEQSYFGEPRMVESEIDHLIDLDTQINILEVTGDVKRLLEVLPDFAERCAAAGLSSREAISYFHLGRIHQFELTQLDAALEFYDRALTLLRRNDNRIERANVLYYRALARAAREDFEGAYADLKVWAKEFEAAHAELSGLAFQQHQLAKNLERYTLLAVVCVQLGKADEALEYIERSRSQTLISFVSSRKIRPSESVPADLHQRFLSLQAERQRLDLLLIQEQTSLQQSSDVGDVGQKLTMLAMEWKQTLEEVANFDPLFEQAFKLRRLQYSEIVQMIPADRPTALIEFFVADGSTLAFFVSRAAQAPKCLSIKGLGRDELHKYLVDKWFEPHRQYAMISAALKTPGNRSNDLKRQLQDARVQLFANIQLVLSEMYQMIFSQKYENGDSLVNCLRDHGIERIILVPHGVLHVLPLHAMSYTSSSGDLRHLIDDFEIVYAPACQVLQQSARHLESANKLVAVVDPDGSLPGARAEVAAIEEFFSTRQVFKGSEATIEAVCRAIEDAGYVHFACHGNFNSKSPLDSQIVLADGPLTLGTIFERVRVNAGCKVTLSACETGLVRPDPTDEYLGLPSGFLFAGASSILASLWEVNDTSTMMLMKQTYEGFCKGKLSLSESLRQAQISLKSNATYGHPYYWAPFQAIGPAWHKIG